MIYFRPCSKTMFAPFSAASRTRMVAFEMFSSVDGDDANCTAATRTVRVTTADIVDRGRTVAKILTLFYSNNYC